MLTAVLGLFIFRETLPSEFTQEGCYVSDFDLLTRTRSVVAGGQFLGRGVCDHWTT
jgi:hypothetical protein